MWPCIWPNPHKCRKTRSIGHSAEAEKELTPWLNRVYLLANICIMVAVGITVFYFQLKNRPKITDIYYTGDYRETARGGFQYTCGCSLPTSLQSPEDLPPSNLAKNVSLNVCYDSSSLKTVTVLIFNAQSTAAAKIEPVIRDASNPSNSLDGMILYRTLPVDGGGYLANQEAHDLSGSINGNGDDTPLPALQSLYVGGYIQETILEPIDYLLSEKFLGFPMSYVRLALVYNCTDCRLCSLDKVNTLITEAVSNLPNGDMWGTCFDWGSSPSCIANSKDSHYQAKCLLYPGSNIPPSFAVKRFLKQFQHLHGITIGADDGPYEFLGYIINTTNRMVLQPNSLYLNISKAVPNSIEFGFAEVVKGSAETSAWWVTLSAQFPTLDTACANIQPVHVCNGTSVCNMFADVKTGYDIKCLDMSNQKQCLEIMADSTADNIPGEHVNQLYTECPPFKCNNSVPPYKVIWNTSSPLMDKDSLNQFLASRILDSYWAQQSGVCTNTYSNVFQYRYTEGEASSNSTLLLATDCVSSNMNTSLYCWLTGEYNHLTDMPEEVSLKRNLSKLNPELFDPTDLQFVCYRVYNQGFPQWSIITVGVVFGWLGTVQLLLTWFVSPVLRWARKCSSRRNDNILSNPPAIPKLLTTLSLRRLSFGD